MPDDNDGLGHKAERAKQRALLRATDATLTIIESELLVDEARRHRDASRLLREQLIAARDFRRLL